VRVIYERAENTIQYGVFRNSTTRARFVVSLHIFFSLFLSAFFFLHVEQIGLYYVDGLFSLSLSSLAIFRLLGDSKGIETSPSMGLGWSGVNVIPVVVVVAVSLGRIAGLGRSVLCQIDVLNGRSQVWQDAGLNK
jgi:hypothetical protein